MNYRTPDLIEKQYKAVRKFIGNIPIRIIDGSQYRYRNIEAIRKRDKNFNVVYFDYNIHHGPGMDYALRTSKYDYLLIFDSDNWPKRHGLLEGMFELMDKKTYGVGTIINGCLMPMTMLLNRKRYFDFMPFIKHGSPLKNTWKDINRINYEPDLYNKLRRADNAAELIDEAFKKRPDRDEIIKHFPCSRYTVWLDYGKSTRRRFGIRLTDKNGDGKPVKPESIPFYAKHTNKDIGTSRTVLTMRQKRRIARLRKLQNYRKRRYKTNT